MNLTEESTNKLLNALASTVDSCEAEKGLWFRIHCFLFSFCSSIVPFDFHSFSTTFWLSPHYIVRRVPKIRVLRFKKLWRTGDLIVCKRHYNEETPMLPNVQRTVKRKTIEWDVSKTDRKIEIVLDAQLSATVSIRYRHFAVGQV